MNQLVVITPSGPQFFNFPNSDLPEYVSNILQAIIDHGGMKSKMQIDSWDASNEIATSKYAVSLIQLSVTGRGAISQDPSTWKCEMSGERVSDNTYLEFQKELSRIFAASTSSCCFT